MRRIPFQLKNKSSRRGVAAVEAALVLPVFIAVSLGIIEYGRAMMVANMVTNAAREGGRIAGIAGSTNADVQNAVSGYLTSALNVSASQVTVNISITPAAGNPNPQNQCANAKIRDLVTVNVQMPYSSVALIPASYLNNVTLTASSSMRHE